MNPKTFDHYLRNEVMSADPLKLVRMLYRAAIEAVSAARARLGEGDIRGRSHEITRALRILHELLRALDRERGGEMAARLAQLYTYVSSRLIEANARQSDEPLAEVERLLSTLLEGWSAIRAATPAAEEPSEYAPLSCSY